jgi:hypothetical protein
VIAVLAACASLAPVEHLVMWPGTGQTGVPTNLVAFIAYQGTAAALADPGLALLDDDGAEVPSSVVELPAAGPDRHAYLLIPAEELAPQTRYFLADEIDWDCAAEPCEAPLRRKHLFTTGDASDTTPPAAPATPRVTAQVADECDHARGILTTLANPGSDAIRYDLYDDDVLIATGAPFLIATACDPGYLAPRLAVPLAPGAHRLRLDAVDLAGNQTEGSGSLTLALACEDHFPEGDEEPEPDEEVGSEGCDAGDGRSSLLLVLVVVGLVRHRRR